MILSTVRTPTGALLALTGTDDGGLIWEVLEADQAEDGNWRAPHTVLARLRLAWHDRSGYLPLAAQVVLAAEIAGLEVVQLPSEYGKPLPLDATP